MDIKGLRYFIEVILARSFTIAAEKMCVTQPTISKMIKKIEEELDTPLLIREGHGRGQLFQLTDSGRIVFEYGQKILHIQAELNTELANLAGITRGELSLGVPPMCGMFFSKVIAEFHKKYPRIELKIIEKGSLGIQQALAMGELDLGMVMTPVDATLLDVLPICNSQLQLITSSQSPLRKKAKVSLKDLAQETFMLYGEGFALNEVIIDACQHAGFVPIVAGYNSQPDFIAAVVEAGMAVALFPKPWCKLLNNSNFVAIPLCNPEISWNVALAWRRNHYLSRAARAYLSLSQEMHETKQIIY